MSSFKHFAAAYKDQFGENIFHVAGRYVPIFQDNSISSAALQMQRELHWFKVERKSSRRGNWSNANNPTGTQDNRDNGMATPGAKWAQERHVQRVIIETDAAAITSFCDIGYTTISWTMKANLQECLSLSRHFVKLCINFTPRSANFVAHTVASKPIGDNFSRT
ncbi:hypothetical protein GIB67_022227, partial [Kingdonia uniflora]